ncbi:MAG: RIO1 family regulatory kinase/ATPase, partial [Myxococcaceae bacterium]
MSESLDILQADGVIDAVLGQLKSGKEAEVWLVQQGEQVLAAKIYKERHARNFKNNAGYREGREVRNSRTARAMAKGSRFGQAAAEDAWRSAEADSLFKLHAEGVRVPTPVVFYEGILLMELVLDPEGHPAPRLVEAPPATPEDARAAYLDLRGNVVRMLCADLIHGDLSAYNVLMSWCGPTIIDFPQTLAAARNNRAEFYFRRDLDSIRNFLAGIDPGLHSLAGDTGEIWNAYVRRELTPDFAPSGRFREAPRRNNETSQQRPPREAPVAAPAASAASVDPVEAELRELEALVLRQGGGARAKPGPVERPGQGGKNRSRPKNGRGPSGGPSGRPPQGRNGRPQQGNDRGARPLNG